MHINPKRIQKLNTKEIQDGPIIYWMNREMRTNDNWSLLYAQQLAQEHKQPLVVVYNLVPNFLGGQKRQLAFKLKALQEIETGLIKKNIPLHVIIDETGKKSSTLLVDFLQTVHAGAVVTDFYPLRLPRSWNAYVRKHTSCACFGVDSHNIVPAWIVSDKKEYGAYTIRPKIFRLLPEFLDEFPVLQKSKYSHTAQFPVSNWETLLSEKELQESLESINWAPPGASGANKILKKFLQNGLQSYAEMRNNPNDHAQSQLSPYLHYGIISSQRIVLETLRSIKKDITHVLHHQKNKAKVSPHMRLTMTDHAGAFLEELIVRKELSDNFCFYEEQYDKVDEFPSWAKESFVKTNKDIREYVYTQKQFEQGKTHDDLWNAAQMQMVITGKMHGYMRMYWAKKILEWTKNPEQAMKIAIYLNDTYSLDGRDPNGYAGIAWSIGGVHDRAWFPRPIFGLVRYMSYGGCKGKFDIEKYIHTWLSKNKI
jgi:deoxyribodipyrimidine photo-lyase